MGLGIDQGFCSYLRQGLCLPAACLSSFVPTCDACWGRSQCPVLGGPADEPPSCRTSRVLWGRTDRCQCCADDAAVVLRRPASMLRHLQCKQNPSRICIRPKPSTPSRSCGCVGHLDDDAVAGKQRCCQWVEDVVERVVPRHDCAHLRRLRTTGYLNFSEPDILRHQQFGTASAQADGCRTTPTG